MGAFLDKPKTEKTSSSGEGYGIKFAVSAMQGWRMEMEDAHICDTKFEGEYKNWSLFGVFDGHAGPLVASYCSSQLKEKIVESLPKKEDQSTDSIKAAIREGFLKMDQDLLKDPRWANGEDHSGATATVVLISPTHIYWANCGDSRGLLCREGKLHFSTVDHKPYCVSEKTRIEKAGGTVMMQRVNGSLAVSRALGDFDYKRNPSIGPTEQLVSPEPDVTVTARDNSLDEFLFIACDGIYDVMSNEDVISYIRRRLELTSDLTTICNDLIDTCLHKNSRDNMSVILVTFPNAPQVSEEAIEKEQALQEEAKAKILTRLEELVGTAQDPLEVEETYVLQQLTSEFPEYYDVAGKRPMISEKLQELCKVKFGESGAIDNDQEYFTGPSDSSSAPPEFLALADQNDDNEMIIDHQLMQINNADTDPSSSDQVEHMEVLEGESSKDKESESHSNEPTSSETTT